MIDSYAVELLFRTRPSGDGAVEALARELGGEAEVTPANGALARIEEVLEHATPPLPEWLVLPPTQRKEERVAASLEQSWWWPEARHASADARWSVSIADRNNRTTDYRRRLGHCQRIVVALIDALSPVAVHWIPSQQLLEPTQFATALREDGFGAPLPGGLNVRFFRLEFDGPASDQEYLMDTVGLTQLGLADLQCHFRGLDPEDVSRTLYETACYEYDHGAILGEGDTVQGPRPDDRWSCSQSSSLAPPERALLDLNPGFPFAAGGE